MLKLVRPAGSVFHTIALALAIGCSGPGGSGVTTQCGEGRDCRADSRPTSLDSVSLDHREDTDADSVARAPELADEFPESVRLPDLGSDVLNEDSQITDSQDLRVGPADCSEDSILPDGVGEIYGDVWDLGDDLGGGQDVGIDYAPSDTYDYFAACTSPCLDDPDLDWCPLGLYLFQVQWADQSSYPLPKGVPSENTALLVRAHWSDEYADPDSWLSSLCGGPCGQHCIPSSGKVYWIDTQTDEMHFIGDEDTSLWASWGPPILPPPGLGGNKVVLPDGKYYILDSGSAPNPSGSCMTHVGNELPCFLEVRWEGAFSPPPMCVSFPLH